MAALLRFARRDDGSARPPSGDRDDERGGTAPIRRVRRATLLEMLALVVMIGIITGSALPRLDRESYSASAAARSVAAQLSYASHRAVSLQSNVRVTIDVANQALVLHEDDNNNGAVDAGERAASWPLPDGATFARGTASALDSATGR